MDETSVKIGKSIKALRKAWGFKRSRLEAMACMDVGRLRQIEEGSPLSTSERDALLRAFGPAAELLLEFAGEGFDEAAVEQPGNPVAGADAAPPGTPMERAFMEHLFSTSRLGVPGGFRVEMRQRDISKPCQCGAKAGEPCRPPTASASETEPTSPLLERLARTMHEVFGEREAPVWEKLPAIVRKRLRAASAAVVGDVLNYLAEAVNGQAEEKPVNGRRRPSGPGVN